MMAIGYRESAAGLYSDRPVVIQTQIQVQNVGQLSLMDAW